MPVYRLTPTQGTESNPLWRASSMRPHCLWVRALDEFDARRQVARATSVLRSRKGAELGAPWNEAALVACEYDDSKDLAAGIIYVRRKAIICDRADVSAVSSRRAE
jgi:hypothetical protein